MPDTASSQELNKRLHDIEERGRLHKHTGGDLSSIIDFDWEIIGQAKLAAASTTISVPSFDSRRVLRLFIEYTTKASNGNTYLRFNNDSGSNYTFIDAGVTARTSQSQIDLIDGANNTLGYFHVVDVINVGSLVKSITATSIQRITSAGTAQGFNRILATWVNTAAAINRIDIISSGGNFPVNSSLLVFGSIV